MPTPLHQRSLHEPPHFVDNNQRERRQMAAHAPQARSIYRKLLRELPSRSPSLLANPSPIQQHIRQDFRSREDDDVAKSLQDQIKSKAVERRLAEAEQAVQYFKAQRTYTTLLERYNPGANMTEEEKVRLTARRVGMDLPVDFMKGEKRE